MAPAQATDDQPLVVLEEVADDLDQTAAENKTAARRLRRLGAQRRNGRPWREVLGGKATRDLLTLVTGLASRLSSATGRLRRGVAQALLSEGLRVRQIADLLGVSHQRVSRVLKENDRASR
jgi:hypothetical protein